MTGEQLRAGLAHIAEQAPEVTVPGDTFARGRRASARARVLAGAAAIACLALVAGLGAAVVRHSEAPVAVSGDNSSRPRVPDHIYAPDDDPALPVTPLDEVGPAVAVYLQSDVHGRAIVVTDEGDYRLVELPHFDLAIGDDVPPLLSPDGTMLAYGAEDALSTYVAVVDLRTGETRRVELGPDLGAIVGSAQWSPNGDWLAWSGQAVKRRSPSSRTFESQEIAGVIRISTAESRALPPPEHVPWHGLGACNDGAAVRFAWPSFLVTTFRDDVDKVRHWHVVSSGHLSCSAPEDLLDLSSADGEKLVGWIPSNGDPVAVVVRPNWDGDQRDSYDDSTLFVDAGGNRTVAGTVEPAGRISIATGLMTVDHPTVPAGPSPWAQSWIVGHRWWVAGVLAAVVLAGLVLVRARAARE